MEQILLRNHTLQNNRTLYSIWFLIHKFLNTGYMFGKISLQKYPNIPLYWNKVNAEKTVCFRTLVHSHEMHFLKAKSDEKWKIFSYAARLFMEYRQESRWLWERTAFFCIFVNLKNTLDREHGPWYNPNIFKIWWREISVFLFLTESSRLVKGAGMKRRPSLRSVPNSSLEMNIKAWWVRPLQRSGSLRLFIRSLLQGRDEIRWYREALLRPYAGNIKGGVFFYTLTRDTNLFNTKNL